MDEWEVKSAARSGIPPSRQNPIHLPTRKLSVYSIHTHTHSRPCLQSGGRRRREVQGGGRFAGGDESKDKQGLNEVASSFLGRRNRGRGRKLVSSVYRTSFLPRPFSPLPRPQDPARRYFFSFSPSGLEESGGKEEEMVWGNGWWCFKSVSAKKN